MPKALRLHLLFDSEITDGKITAHNSSHKMETGLSFLHLNFSISAFCVTGDYPNSKISSFSKEGVGTAAL
jgi:hypothetical protein